MRKYRIIGSLLLLAVMCVACNPDSGKKKISIAYANWLEGIAMSHLAKVVLEEKGYEVELLNADVAPVFASVSRKKADVFMDAWLPVTMKDYIDHKPNRWRVENSWGDAPGKKGYYVMSDEWFDEYMYQIVVNKKYLPDSYIAEYDSEPIMLEPWDPMGSLAL